MGLPFIKEAITQLFSKPSTELYPFVQKDAPEGYRGRIVFYGDKCIGCGMCERVCAGGAISTHIVEEQENGTVFARRFFLGSCTFCNTCAEYCSTHAIELSKDYHMVARTEDELVVEGNFFKKKIVKPAAPPAKPAPAPEAPAGAPAPAAKRAETEDEEESSESCYVDAPKEWKAPEKRSDGKPVNDHEKCIHCGLCARNCPMAAITVDRASKTWTIDYDACVACGTCVAECPKKCLMM